MDRAVTRYVCQGGRKFEKRTKKFVGNGGTNESDEKY